VAPHRRLHTLTLAFELSLIRDVLPLTTAALPVTEVDAGRLDPVWRGFQYLSNAAAQTPFPHDLGTHCLARDAVLNLDRAIRVPSG
jgi:hypothetical protein